MSNNQGDLEKGNLSSRGEIWAQDPPRGRKQAERHLGLYVRPGTTAVNLLNSMGEATAFWGLSLTSTVRVGPVCCTALQQQQQQPPQLFAITEEGVRTGRWAAWL